MSASRTGQRANQKSGKRVAEIPSGRAPSQKLKLDTSSPALSPIKAERVADAACVNRFELAELLNVSLRTVDRMIAAGEIRVRHVRGKAVRFLRSDVEEYLKANAEILKAES